MTNAQRIQELRERGVEVHVLHRRPTNKYPEGSYVSRRCLEPGENHLAHGGTTSVRLVLPLGGDFHGHADCSTRDNFNKKIGLAIALGRACKAAGL